MYEKLYGAWSVRYKRWWADQSGRIISHPQERLVKANLLACIDGGINQYEVQEICENGLPRAAQFDDPADQFGTELERRTAERDSARAELERALSSCRVKDDVLAHVRSILKTPVNADIARWASSVAADAKLGRMVRNMPRDMKLVPRARASCRYWATFMQFDGGDEADVEFQSPEEALKAAGVTS